MHHKKILVISYSQTGQLNRVVDSFISPLKNNNSIEIFHKLVKPKTPYPFPWNLITFMDSFPEAIALKGCAIEEFEQDNHDYDLIILAYQVWFLSPSIPIVGFLQSDYAKEKFKNKPVITLIGCRNMWVMAQEKMKVILNNLSSTLIDNVVFIDQGNALETFITTPRWLLTGKKNSVLGLSEAGISEEEIKNASRFGKALVKALNNDKEKTMQPLLTGLKAVDFNVKLLRSEKIATKSFTIWGALIRKLGKPGAAQRKPAIIFYLIFLLMIIITIVPLNMAIQSLLLILKKESLAKQKKMYELPSGNLDNRMKEFL